MCGLNGMTKSGVRDIHVLRHMNNAIRHRGPDYDGSYEDDHVLLGHRLLSIRGDISNSIQPYTKKDSPWVLVFNGQIYNTEQLKKNLPEEYRPETIDTSLLFGTIERYGWGFINHIHGMYAIALYNADEQQIRLYRDPSGQKPLYYHINKNAFVFSSEIRGILKHPKIERDIDHDAIKVSAVLGFLPGSKTLFTQIKKVQPSECIAYAIPEKKLQVSFFKSHAPHYFPAHFDEALSQLMSEHLLSKKTIAINLSGGLDSSLLLHLMAKAGHVLKSYSTRFDFEGGSFNQDAELAKRLAHDYGAQHTEVTITKKDYLDNFIESYASIEEPRNNVSIPTYHILAKRHGISGDKNRVVISGDGGDEIFGGYPHYLRNVRDTHMMRLYSSVLFSFVRNVRNDTAGLNYAHPWDRWFFYKYNKYLQNQFLVEPVTAGFISRYLGSSVSELLDIYKQKDDPIYETMLVDRFIWLAGENFIRTDKLFMSQSVEMRSPFAFHPFREYVDKLIDSHGYIDGSNNKLFLRNWAKEVLPSYITNRAAKSGWRAPAHDWYDKDTKKLYLEIVSNAKKKSGARTIVDWDKLQGHLTSNQTWPGRNVHFFISLAVLAESLDAKL